MTTRSPGSQRCHHLWRNSRLTRTSLAHSPLTASKVQLVSLQKKQTLQNTILYKNGVISHFPFRSDEPAEPGAGGEYPSRRQCVTFSFQTAAEACIPAAAKQPLPFPPAGSSSISSGVLVLCPVERINQMLSGINRNVGNLTYYECGKVNDITLLADDEEKLKNAKSCLAQRFVLLQNNR